MVGDSQAYPQLSTVDCLLISGFRLPAFRRVASGKVEVTMDQVSHFIALNKLFFIQ